MDVNRLASAIARRLNSPGRTSSSAKIMASAVARKIGRTPTRGQSPKVLASIVASRVSSRTKPVVKVRIDSRSANHVASLMVRRLKSVQSSGSSVDRLADTIAKKLGYQVARKPSFVDVLASAVAKRLAVAPSGASAGESLPVEEENMKATGAEAQA